MDHLPYATQTLNNKDQIVRKGECTQHEGKTSTKFQGEQPDLESNKVYWAFLCDYNKGKKVRGHIFINLPPRGIPRTSEELKVWFDKQKAARIQTLDKNKRTKK